MAHFGRAMAGKQQPSDAKVSAYPSCHLVDMDKPSLKHVLAQLTYNIVEIAQIKNISLNSLQHFVTTNPTFP